jgi:protein phosphatase 1L
MSYQTATLQGHRPYNEDRVDIQVNSDIEYYGLFDGHGGTMISEYLKTNLAQYFLKCDIREHTSKYIKKIYDLIQEKLTHYITGSKNTGSTALVTIIYKLNNNKYINIINLGDCRTVICNKYNIASPLTKDHKPKSFEEYYRITKLGGIIEEDPNDDPRISGMAVSKAFGDLDAKPFVSHEPDIYEYSIRKDKFIVMASDGLWDVLSNQDVVDFILYELAKQTKTSIAKKLVKYAFDKGSQDNITAIIIFL